MINNTEFPLINNKLGSVNNNKITLPDFSKFSTNINSNKYHYTGEKPKIKRNNKIRLFSGITKNKISFLHLPTIKHLDDIKNNDENEKK